MARQVWIRVVVSAFAKATARQGGRRGLVFFAGWEPDDVARTDFLDGASLALRAAVAGGINTVIQLPRGCMIVI